MGSPRMPAAGRVWPLLLLLALEGPTSALGSWQLHCANCRSTQETGPCSPLLDTRTRLVACLWATRSSHRT